MAFTLNHLEVPGHASPSIDMFTGMLQEAFPTHASRTKEGAVGESQARLIAKGVDPPHSPLGVPKLTN